MKTREDYIRPSTLSALADCPAAAEMQAEYVNRFGEPTAPPEADTGNEIHGYAGSAITAWKLGASWGDAIAAQCNGAATAGLDAWSVRCIQLCGEFARDLIAKHGIAPECVLTEQRLDMEATGFRRGGTADLVLVDPFKRVILVDWKCGYLDQGDASEHDQLFAYADAAAATYKVQEVIVYLFQPRAEKPMRASGATFDAASLAKNRAWAVAVTNRARLPDPELAPGYNACKHCKALSRCAAAKEWYMRLLEALAVLGEPTDADAWGEVISAAKVAEKAAEQAIDAGKGHLITGGTATGWHMQPGATMTKIDAAKAIELAKAGGFLEDLLRFASIRAEAAKALEIAAATSSVAKAPSLKPMRATAAA